ncbi:MAG: hypothetical protein NT056_00165 [Proteobacteria bacterium]|nr:hypothetical protein [Pseudomonadota bacterium]
MHLKRGTWIFLFFLLLVAFAGLKFGPPYIRYIQFNYLLHNEASDALRLTNEEIRHDILTKIEELNLPIDPDNVVFIEQKKNGLENEPYVLLERGKDYFSITSEYQVTVHLVGKYEHVLNFSPEIYAEISAGK